MAANSYVISASRAGVGATVVYETSAGTFNDPGVGVITESGSGGGGGGTGTGIYITGLLGLQFRPT